MNRLLSLITFLSLIRCQVVSKETVVTFLETESSIYKDTSIFIFDGRNSPARVSESFQGEYSRQIKGDVLTFTADPVTR